MGKRIRHLEFYGYPDQNVFTSLGNIDLSEIKETNKEQDKEIKDLTDEKADLSLVLELSGKVDTFIDEQDEFNKSVVSAFSGMTSRITALEGRDEEITNKINELTDEVNASKIAIGDLGDSVSELNVKVDEHISGYNDFVESVNDKFEHVGETIEKKLDKDDADEIYAKKAEVYSRDEADSTFLKEHQDISHLATKDELASVEEKVDSIDVNSFAKKDDLDSLSGDFATFKTATEDDINSINENLSGVTREVEKTSQEVSSLSGSIDDVRDDLNTVIGNVNDLSSYTQSVDSKVDEVASKLPNYVTTSAFTNYVNEQDEINRTKADKSETSVLSGMISAVSDAISQEKAERISADTAIGNEITNTNARVSELATSVEDVRNDISDVNGRIDEEIENRIEADKNLIGTSADTMMSDTIWGAKKYANSQRSAAVAEAKAYSDDVFEDIETMLTNELDNVRIELSGKATKSYVDSIVDERDAQVRADLNSKIDAEINRAKSSENNLQHQINEIAERSSSADTKDIYKRINVITTYSGDTPEEYVNTGNGVLDVLHREFHALEDEIGIITNPTLQKTNEYEVAFGTYNISNTSSDASGQTAFSIGIGTSDDDRKNAAEIRKNGDLYLWVEGEFMKVNDLLAMLAHETYN
jgi:uncharacterized protein YoxC